MNQEKIGKFIAELRKEKNLTQEDLANKLGITKNAVSKWERGISMMDVSLLKPVCEILNISIVELLNGERIDEESIKNKSDDTIKNTIEYSNKRIKKSRIKNIGYTILGILILIVTIFFGYKYSLLNEYTLKKPDNVDEFLKGLKNSKEVKVYKRTIPENEYFVLGNFKMKNVLDGYVQEGEVVDIQPYLFRKKDGDKSYGITFPNEINNYQMIDIYAADVVIGGIEGENNFEKKFNAADRKYFLLKNDINNDVDFYKYVTENYYKENNIFMSKREMMENYSFNSFVAIAGPQIEGITYLSGDYEGYVINLGTKNGITVTEVSIIKYGRRFGFVTNDPRFAKEDFLIDLIGTIEIR